MIYLDHNATTPPDPDVLETMRQAAVESFGNPGSRHLAGRVARQVLEDARETIAEILGELSEEVIFTSGGTESSNLALFGFAAGRKGTVLLPPGEHPATDEPVRRLVKSGWRRAVLPIDGLGRLEQEELDRLPLDDVLLATALLAHNETGVIQDLAPLASRCEEHGIPLHVDAVQAVGKIDVSFRELRAATLSVGAHKFHGPRGIGALLVRKGSRLSPLLLGGHQERGLRPGTEPVMLAAGMANALQIWHAERTVRAVRLRALRDRLECGLRECCPPAVVNGDPAHRLPNTLNIAFPGCHAEALLVALDLEGVCCSLGSACASGSLEPAPILLAMGLPPEVYNSSLRLSVGKNNTADEIDEAIRVIGRIVTRLRGS